MPTNSRISGLRDHTPEERLALVVEGAGLDADALAALRPDGGLSLAQADHMVENVVPARVQYRRHYYFKEACAAAGAPHVRIHDLRHCHGQWAVRAGAQQNEVKAQLRHRDIATTDIYVQRKNSETSARAVATLVPGGRPVPEG